MILIPALNFQRAITHGRFAYLQSVLKGALLRTVLIMLVALKKPMPFHRNSTFLVFNFSFWLWVVRFEFLRYFYTFQLAGRLSSWRRKRERTNRKKRTNGKPKGSSKRSNSSRPSSAMTSANFRFSTLKNPSQTITSTQRVSLKIFTFGRLHEVEE